MKPWETLWSPMKPYGALWSPMKPYGALWNLMKPYEAPWSPMEPYETYGTLWKLLLAVVFVHSSLLAWASFGLFALAFSFLEQLLIKNMKQQTNGFVKNITLLPSDFAPNFKSRVIGFLRSAHIRSRPLAALICSFSLALAAAPVSSLFSSFEWTRIFGNPFFFH